MESSNSEAKWYIAQVLPGSEKRVVEDIKDVVQRNNLSHLIVDVFLPSETSVTQRRGKKVNVERKVFPGYILIQMVMNEESWRTIKKVQKVSNFLGHGGKPKPLTESEIQLIFQQIEEGALSRQSAVTFSVGETISVTDGPFDGFVGTVEEVDAQKERLKISISILGRPTKIDLEYSQVSKSG